MSNDDRAAPKPMSRPYPPPPRSPGPTQPLKKGLDYSDLKVVVGQVDPGKSPAKDND